MRNNYKGSEQARKTFRRSREEIGNVNAELQESIAAVREVQAFNRADENIEQFKEVNAANRDANVRAVAYTSALAPTLEAFSYVGLAIVTGVGGWYLLKGTTLFGTTVTLGLVVTFLAYVQRFNQPIQQIAVLWTNIQNAIAGGERIFHILDEQPAVTDKAGAQEMPQINGRVEFTEVSHEYEDGVPVLNKVTFSVADRYLARPACPSKDWQERTRVPHILDIAREWKAQGAIVLQQKFCDPHETDIPAISMTLKDNGIPTLFLELDVTVPVGQFKVRTDAFLEMISADELF